MAAPAVPGPPLPDAAEPNWAADPIARSLAGHGGARVDLETLITELCEALVGAGVPLWRASCGVPTLHPQVRGYQVVWRRDRAGAATIRHRRGVERTSYYLDSPVRVLHEGAGAVRRRLDVASPRLDFPILPELAAEGATDYVAMPLRFTDGRIGYVSWVSDRPGGFTARELSRLDELLPLIALRVELEARGHLTQSLLETYLGRDAARRVLSGQITRGHGTHVEAAILYSDLRGFTDMTDRLPAHAVIGHLNDYFDVMASTVERYGGEVLKFIGDGTLAAFNIDGTSPSRACCQALHAAIEALRLLGAANRDRDLPLAAGVALHFGDVVYGNIGGASRLDFTVIGAAVNEATRIEALCRVLDRPLLISSSFARICRCEPLASIGLHRLRGVREPQEVFEPARATG